MNVSVVVGLLTYNRKKLLEDTLSSLFQHNDMNRMKLLIVDNNSSVEYQETNIKFAKMFKAKYIFNNYKQTEDTNQNIEIGHRRLIDEMLLYDADLYITIEDDWHCMREIPVLDVKNFLNIKPHIGQIRLRDFRYDDSYYGGSSINFVTMKKIVFTDKVEVNKSVFHIANLHWVNSCNLMTRNVLEKMNVPFEQEIDRMIFFHDLYPYNAQLTPPIFYHTGPYRIREDLKKRGLFCSENISQN